MHSRSIVFAGNDLVLEAEKVVVEEGALDAPGQAPARLQVDRLELRTEENELLEHFIGDGRAAQLHRLEGTVFGHVLAYRSDARLHRLGGLVPREIDVLQRVVPL